MDIVNTYIRATNWMAKERLRLDQMADKWCSDDEARAAWHYFDSKKRKYLDEIVPAFEERCRTLNDAQRAKIMELARPEKQHMIERDSQVQKYLDFWGPGAAVVSIK